MCILRIRYQKRVKNTDHYLFIYLEDRTIRLPVFWSDQKKKKVKVTILKNCETIFTFEKLVKVNIWHF